MSTYLLLRNNKESGPYALGDLVKNGLKAYDLVWIEGKSAAWRYPGEIEELKPYAPMVEEQPFDRFFKRDTTVQKEPPVVVAKKTSTLPDTRIEEKYRKYIPKKSVVVTLPQQKKVVVQMPVSKPVTAVPASTPAPAPIPAPVPVPTATITVKENPATPKIKYYQTLDEIKEMYVKTLQERKGKITRKAFLTKNLKRAAVIAGLVTIGLLAGFIIKSGSGDKENIASQQTVPAVPVINNEQQQETAAGELIQEAPANDVSSNQEVQQQSTAIDKVNQPVKQKERPASNTIVSKKETQPASTEKKKEVVQEPVIAPKGVEQNPATGERNSVIRDENGSVASGSNDEPAIKAVKKNNWDKTVLVSNNDYKRVAFGGIRNLELTVTNESKYVLDKVVVELQYLKNSDVLIKTENVEFELIAPKGTQTLRIPDTNRGAKISYRVVRVQQLQPETASAGL